MKNIIRLISQRVTNLFTFFNSLDYITQRYKTSIIYLNSLMGAFSISFIILFIALGLVLLLVEIFILPGTSIAGLSGLAMIVLGVVLSYSSLGIEQGNIILILSAFATIFLLVVAYKTVGGDGQVLDYKLNESRVKTYSQEETQLKQGDKGVALGDIRPEGKAIINQKVYPVTSMTGFISDNAALEVVDIRNNEILVKMA